MLLFIGLAFGAFAPGDRPLRSRAFVAGAITAVVFTAVAMTSYVIAPDWMWMYFLDSSNVVWSVPLVAVGYLVTFLVGFAAALGLRTALGTSSVWLTAAWAVASEIVVIALTWDRYHLVGTKAQWIAGRAHELFSTSPSGPVKTLGLMGPIFPIVLVVGLIIAGRARRATPTYR